VLRSDALLWVNLGTSYAGGGQYRGNSPLSAKQATSGGARSESIINSGPTLGSVCDKMRLRRDLTPEQLSYVLAELSKAALTAASTRDGLP
jgi:hypothetical protein